jgi:Na+/citrate or Na+/malate symporter
MRRLGMEDRWALSGAYPWPTGTGYGCGSVPVGRKFVIGTKTKKNRRGTEMTWIAVVISLMVLAVAVAIVPALVAINAERKRPRRSDAGAVTKAREELVTASEPAVLAGKTEDMASLTNGLQHPTDFRPAFGPRYR